MRLDSLQKLYLHELKDIYNGEQQILKSLPKMVQAASFTELRAAFEEHLEQTRGHVDRLEQIFQKLDEPAKDQKCKGLEGIINEGDEILKDGDVPPAVADAALIAAAQRVEHYEMAVYGTVRNYARRLGFEDQAPASANPSGRNGNRQEVDYDRGLVYQRRSEVRQVANRIGRKRNV